MNTSVSLDAEKGKLGRLVFKDTDSPILHSQVKIFRGATTCTKDGLLAVKVSFFFFIPFAFPT